MPRALDLATPRLSLRLLLGQSPPPVALPESGARDAADGASDGFDHLTLRDGRALRGKILTQVQEGFLFHDAVSNASFVVPFADIADLQRPAPLQLRAEPQLPPARESSSGERRFFLESSLRDLQMRYDALSLWPGIETLIGGAVGLGVAILIVALVGTDTLDLVFAGLSGVLGAISLVSGIAEVVSIEKREGELTQQMAAVQDQLSQLPRTSLSPAVPRPAFAVRF